MSKKIQEIKKIASAIVKLIAEKNFEVKRNAQEIKVPIDTSGNIVIDSKNYKILSVTGTAAQIFNKCLGFSSGKDINPDSFEIFLNKQIKELQSKSKSSFGDRSKETINVYMSLLNLMVKGNEELEEADYVMIPDPEPEKGTELKETTIERQCIADIISLITKRGLSNESGEPLPTMVQRGQGILDNNNGIQDTFAGFSTFVRKFLKPSLTQHQ